jgi:hypothetical protein
MTEPEPRFCVLTGGVWHHLIGATAATDAGLDVDRAYCPEHDQPAAEHEHDERCAGRTDAQMFAAFVAEHAAERALIDYGECLEIAIGLNERYAGRWRVWFVALAGSVEWLARPADAEPVGEPTFSAWSPGELINKIARHM